MQATFPSLALDRSPGRFGFVMAFSFLCLLTVLPFTTMTTRERWKTTAQIKYSTFPSSDRWIVIENNKNNISADGTQATTRTR